MVSSFFDILLFFFFLLIPFVPSAALQCLPCHWRPSRSLSCHLGRARIDLDNFFVCGSCMIVNWHYFSSRQGRRIFCREPRDVSRSPIAVSCVLFLFWSRFCDVDVLCFLSGCCRVSFRLCVLHRATVSMKFVGPEILFYLSIAPNPIPSPPPRIMRCELNDFQLLSGEGKKTTPLPVSMAR